MTTPPTTPESPCSDPADDTVVGIVAEFSEVFSFVRSRSARYARRIHPDLKNSGIFVLHTVLRNEPITATELAQRLEMDKAMISRQVTLLRSLGLVETEPDPTDRRSTLLRSTELSRSKVAELRRQMSADYQARFADWAPEDLTALRDSLRRFNDRAD
ncbi:MarR family winged helix-turn-helix transcriptional regulator [Leucobacter sp. M11]|uniref:MarR family winged helix-turn-helix transcriptional regulator n=1 Tax=Leucobacter sp. M11 TaxID=2993565 RepID=UPI002D7E2E43|nr:MarR family transcriptional regulator [Leucobacter sp. M11]MEB4615385.1 MarR family transcriptional regulator [Leucobacter sp. M11]